MEERLRLMFDELARARGEVQPSKYWEQLNRKNLRQLEEHGYRSFKRTIARNYFTWIVSPLHDQVRFLREHLPHGLVLASVARSLFSGKHPPLSRKQSLRYAFLTYLLWEYASRQDADRILEKLEEPVEGNPPRIFRRGKLIGQDLANSVLEYRSIFSGEVEPAQVRTVMELGPGYGRTA